MKITFRNAVYILLLFLLYACSDQTDRKLIVSPFVFLRINKAYTKSEEGNKNLEFVAESRRYKRNVRFSPYGINSEEFVLSSKKHLHISTIHEIFFSQSSNKPYCHIQISLDDCDTNKSSIIFNVNNYYDCKLSDSSKEVILHPTGSYGPILEYNLDKIFKPYVRCSCQSISELIEKNKKLEISDQTLLLEIPGEILGVNNSVFIELTSGIRYR